jgi:prefoldin subunit 5
MWMIYAALIALSALVALYAGFVALRAGLSLRRTQREFQQRISPDLDRLQQRTALLQGNIDRLNREASELPIKIARLQQNLALLKFLADTLNASINELRRVLKYTDFKNFGANLLQTLADAFLNPKK